MGGVVSLTELLLELSHMEIHLEARDDRLRCAPRRAVTAELLNRLSVHKWELIKTLALGRCPYCESPRLELPTRDGYLNLECPVCDWCFGCAPLVPVKKRPSTPTPVLDERGDIFDHVEPCLNCGGVDYWWNGRNEQFCLSCQPPAPEIVAFRNRISQLRIKVQKEY